MTNFGRESQVGSDFAVEQAASAEVVRSTAERLAALNIAQFAGIQVEGHGQTMSLEEAIDKCDPILAELESRAQATRDMAEDFGLSEEEVQERVQGTLHKRLGEMATENNSPDVLEILQKKN